MLAIPPSQALSLRVALAHTATDLHESTDPSAIAATQRAEVAAYLDAVPFASVAEMIAALVIPLWLVECRMWELAGLPILYRNSKPGKMSSTPGNPFIAEKADRMRRA